MAQYNLIQNSFISTLTTSGTGNRVLTSSELSKLYNNDTVASGVALTDTDEIFLEIDLLSRIKLNGVSIYFDTVIDRTTALSNINFYYKNETVDTYLLLSSEDDGAKFYASNTPSLFAPRYILMVIDKIEGNLFETTVFNDDYEVAFGEDGTTTELEMDEFEEVSTIPIYNNSELGTAPVDAYISVDFQNNVLDYYLGLSSNPEGPFTGLSSAVGVNNTSITDYTWEMGSFVNTIVNNSRVELIPYAYTPIINYEAVWNFTTPLPIVNPIDSFPSVANHYSLYGWGVQQNCWDWADNGYSYAIGRVKEEPGNIKLYRYNTIAKKWDFVHEILTLPIWGATANYFYSIVTMACMGNYVYIIANTFGLFGRHDVTGVSGNWEELTDCPFYDASYPHTFYRQGLCSDKTRYLYALKIQHSSLAVNLFCRYDITDNTWTTLDTGFNQGLSLYLDEVGSLAVCYDMELDCVYLTCGEGTKGLTTFQKYDVALDVWETNWRDSTATSRTRGFSYYGGYFAYISYNTDNIVVYAHGTGLTYKLVTPSKSTSVYGPFMLCFPSPDGSVMLAVTRLTDSLYEPIYYYNLGREYEAPMTGYYYSPIISMDDKFNSSYVHLDYTAVSGTSVSTSELNPADTLLVRSNNTAPRTYNSVFSLQKTEDDIFFIVQGDSNTGELNGDYSYLNLSVDVYYHPETILFDKTNNTLVFLIREIYSTNTSSFHCYDLAKRSVTYSSTLTTSYLIENPNHLDIDIVGNIWGYYNQKLFKMTKQLALPTVNITKDTNDFLYALAANKRYASCWYSDKATNFVVHINSEGEEICSVPFTEPTHLCATIDGGCLALDASTNTLKMLDYYGEEIKTIVISSYLNVNSFFIDPIAANYIWLLEGGMNLIKINMDGVVQKEIPVISATTLVDGGDGGCLVHSDILKVSYQIDSEGAFTHTWDFGTLNDVAYKPCVVFYTYSELCDRQLPDLFEELNDPIWSGEDGWNEVKINDNSLPSRDYHQFKIKMHSDSGADTPYLDKLIVPTPLKVSDIHPKTSKPIYLKTEFPTDAANQEYESRLRCWWGK